MSGSGLVECNGCKGAGWAWDNHCVRWVTKPSGYRDFVPCKKWKYCGWCAGTGKIDTWECDSCHGGGTMSDDSYETFGCPWCDGKGCKPGAPKGWKKRVWGEGRLPNPRKKKAPKPEQSRWDML